MKKYLLIGLLLGSLSAAAQTASPPISQHIEAGQYLQKGSNQMLTGLALGFVGGGVVALTANQASSPFRVVGYGGMILGGVLGVSGVVNIGRAGRTLQATPAGVAMRF